MEVVWKPGFDEQRRRFAFRFTCEHCAHFDDLTDECLHGYPNQMHRLTLYEREPRPREIMFCKEFDLA
jgi:hypothetical protein